jgi:myo-inositol-1(or 4)-monophosphatase
VVSNQPMSPPDPATPDPHPADAGLVLELAGLTRELALGGGRLARVGRIGGFRVGSKSTPTDLVTDIDRSVESWIVGELAARRPGDAIVGEEGTDSVGTSRVRWLIDPIDGTVNFALGLPHYAVSIAAELDGDVVAGCVHNPESGETFRAQRGERAVLEYVRGGRGNRLQL